MPWLDSGRRFYSKPLRREAFSLIDEKEVLAILSLESFSGDLFRVPKAHPREPYCPFMSLNRCLPSRGEGTLQRSFSRRELGTFLLGPLETKTPPQISGRGEA